MDKKHYAFLLLATMMRTHPDKNLVNAIHAAFMQSSLHMDYMNGTWDSFSLQKNKE